MVGMVGMVGMMRWWAYAAMVWWVDRLFG